MQRFRNYRQSMAAFRSLIICGAVAAALYVVAVLWHVQAIPEIGLHCTFYPTVTRVDIERIRSRSGEPLPPLIGMVVERVGDRRVETWPDFLRAIEQLDRVDFSHDPTSAVNYANFDSADWVDVQLRPAGGLDPLHVWCRVGALPAVALLPSLVWFAIELGVLLVASFVYWNRPTDRAARQFYVMTLVAVGAFMGGYHWYRIATHPLLISVYIGCAVMLPAVALHFYELFPRPKLWLVRRPNLALAATYGPSLLFLVLIYSGYANVRAISRSGAPAAAVEAGLLWLRYVIYVYFAVAGALYIASVACLAYSYRSAVGIVERNQVRWIFIGSMLAIVPLGYSFYLAIWRRGEFSGGGALWPMFGASICFTVAFAVSITRYRLLQLDKLVGAGLAYFLVSGLAAAVYYVLVFAGTLIMGRHSSEGPSLEQAFWVSGSSLVLIVGLDLARSRLRRALDKRYRRDKTQLDRTLQQLGEAVEQLVDPPTLVRRMLRATADLLGVSDGAVYLRGDDPAAFRAVGSIGRDPGFAEIVADGPLASDLRRFDVVPPRAVGASADGAAVRELVSFGGALAAGLTHEGLLRAILVLGPKSAGGAFTDDELNSLDAFVSFTAAALASAEGHRTIEALNRELQTKVEKIAEQQRRILALQQQLTTQTRVSAAREPRPVPADESPVPGIVGSAPALREVLALARKVAISPSAVLIRGESGTGKELLAQAVHDHSPRSAKPFVKVHCAALAPGLLESELFGHVKGAFTGAVRDKLGRFEAADGGTLFLDEIGDISPDVQTKLLRVLQEKTFERVGSNEAIRVDVRLVAATHQNLEQLIRQGRFRDDLFYRLNVIALAMPPLRDRRDDIPELATHFLTVYAARAGKPVDQLDDDALLALREYPWPGNIRELENAIERAVVIAEGGIIGLNDLPPEVARGWATQASNGGVSVEARGVLAERAERHQRERDALLNALAAADGNKAEAARLLGMARSTLVSRLKKFGLLN